MERIDNGKSETVFHSLALQVHEQKPDPFQHPLFHSILTQTDAFIDGSTSDDYVEEQKSDIRRAFDKEENSKVNLIRKN